MVYVKGQVAGGSRVFDISRRQRRNWVDTEYHLEGEDIRRLVEEPQREIDRVLIEQAFPQPHTIGVRLLEHTHGGLYVGVEIVSSSSGTDGSCVSLRGMGCQTTGRTKS